MNKLGNQIGEGGCSEVFEWEDSSKIIKIAKTNTTFEAMENEFHNNRMAWESGLPVARPYELIEINGRTGIVCERIYGESLMERFLRRAFSQSFDGEDIRMTARILSQVHSKANVRLRSSQKENLKYSIQNPDYLNADEKEKVIFILDHLPSKESLCHGDPNPGNILMKKNGNAVLIDWMNASIGNPAADIAEYIIMIRYAILPSHIQEDISSYFDAIREEIIKIFMDEYTQLTGITDEEVSAWILPVAARKLSADAISESEKSLLLQEIRRNINGIGV